MKGLCYTLGFKVMFITQDKNWNILKSPVFRDPQVLGEVAKGHFMYNFRVNYSKKNSNEKYKSF